MKSDSKHPLVHTGAGPLLDRVQRVVGVSSLRAAIERAMAGDGGRVHASGLRGTSSVLLVEALRLKLKRSVVVVLPDEESAEDAHSDFRTLSVGNVALFPERDLLPHRAEMRENLTVRGARNECLLRIDNGHADVVVTSLLGLLEKTTAPQSLRAHRVSLRCGDDIELEALRSRLVTMGYVVTAVVEEAGTFAVRGSIVDVFDPSWDYPARIELDGDTVASIRTFDLDSQRSMDSVSAVTVLPASSAALEADAAVNLEAYLRERDFDTDVVRRIGEEIAHNRHSELWRRYAPALGTTASVLDYFATPPVLFFVDAAGHNRAHARMREDFAHVAKRAGDDFPMLPFDDYVHPADFFERRGVATVWLHEIGGSAPEGQEAIYPPPSPGEPLTQFASAQHPSVVGKLEPLLRQIRSLHGKGVDVHVYSETATQRERIADMLEEDEALVHLPVGWITSGFVWLEAAIAVLTDHQIFNRILPRPKKRRARRRAQGMRHDHLQIGDYVVHIDYGIARFTGLEKLGSGDAEAECLALRFDGGDRIFVPLDQMHVVEKYVGKEGVEPRVDKLGGTRWQKTKEKAKKAIEDIARELLHVYAEREVADGVAFPADTQWQRELEASFPYEETPHQLRATAEIKEDLQSEKPMDRLICGDVGYGKTEVAIRAAFKVAAAGRQVAVLVPTTLLASQHLHTIKERMERFPLRIEMLSRFVSPSGQKRVLAGLADGSVDIVVGTHRLISKDVKFKKLGLLVIDEEHRFGVKHKERLKQMTKSVDVLALTATPIPRTLYMSLSGLRRISVIDTPPQGRHPVKTEVTGFDEDLIADAITQEIRRDGQVFFVHNRVRSIRSMAAFLEKLLPGVRVAVAHGQMGEHELEDVILAFIDRKYDVLISTMIIESGLDFPNVNTILVNRADRFGLAQLYQLRGRVGRRERQAYAYFMVPRQLSLTEAASRRLQAMEEFEELGSGYRLAMRDLEIRGAGNVLGVQQHGHVAAIGFELYCRMLKEAVEEVRDGRVAAPVSCRVESPYPCFIPPEYIADPDERMMVYKRLAGMEEPDDAAAMRDELVDRFGRTPGPVDHLLDLTWVKLIAARLGVVLVQLRGSGYRRPRPAVLEQAAQVPNKMEEAPRGVRRSRTGSDRLARVARSMGSGVGSDGPPAGGVTLDFGPGKSLSPAQCAALAETFGSRLLFKAGTAFSIQLAAAAETDLLADTRNLLQVAYFSTRIVASPTAAEHRFR